jgi:hypothetical protein
MKQFIDNISSESELCYDTQSIGQLILEKKKHPSEAYEQIFITVRKLLVCWSGAPSLTRGRVCFYNVQYIYILDVILR